MRRNVTSPNLYSWEVYTVPPHKLFIFLLRLQTWASNPCHTFMNCIACDVPVRPRLHIVMRSLNPWNGRRHLCLTPNVWLCVWIMFVSVYCQLVPDCPGEVLNMFIMRRMCVFVCVCGFAGWWRVLQVCECVFGILRCMVWWLCIFGIWGQDFSLLMGRADVVYVGFPECRFFPRPYSFFNVALNLSGYNLTPSFPSLLYIFSLHHLSGLQKRNCSVTLYCAV